MIQKKIDELEDKLFDFLSRIKSYDFNNCYDIKNPKNKFYSPYILGLMGLFLLTIKTRISKVVINEINNKLMTTPNRSGLFNFYGNDEYYYDVDTTSIVNTFLGLNKLKNLSYHKNICNILNENLNENQNYIKTWLNRPSNNFDWFVNYNYLLYLHTLGQHNERVKDFLLKEQLLFFSNGSRYYSDLSFPLFLIDFYSIELGFQIGILEVYRHEVRNVTNSEIDLIKRQEINSNLLSLERYIDSPRKYFNSSKTSFASKELNATILLYLLNKYYERSK